MRCNVGTVANIFLTGFVTGAIFGLIFAPLWEEGMNEVLGGKSTDSTKRAGETSGSKEQSFPTYMGDGETITSEAV